LFLDLSRDNILDWQIPQGINTAFFCASATKLEFCRAEPEQTRKINVDNTLLLAEKLDKKGISIIYPSTSQVFDGSLPYRKAEDQVCPNVEYGRQKAAAEKGILGISGKHSIVRFTKILGQDNSLIRGWLEDLKKKRIIRPFFEMVLAPLSPLFAAQIMIEIAQKNSPGIWQVSAEKDITYEELARYLAEKLKADSSLVKAISVQESGIIMEAIAKYTTLDTARLEKELGYNRPCVWTAIDSIYGL
jgi:dTDP-4-dehydrorhamnose reductase